MHSIALIRVILTSLVIAVSSTATAEISVSSNYFSRVVNGSRVSIGAGSYQYFELKIQRAGRMMLDAKILNEIFSKGRILLCDHNNMMRFSNRESARCFEKLGSGSIRAEFDLPSAGNYYVIIDNRFSVLLTKNYEVTITTPSVMNVQTKIKLEQMLGLFQFFADQVFQIPSIDLTVNECGIKNAFSNTTTGNITFCSELIADMFAANQEGGVVFILGHEFGHSLLSLLNHPNNANEETVDEIATFLLLLVGGDSAIPSAIEYFASRNSHNEAMLTLNSSNTHPISVQRARNIQRNAIYHQAFMRRWENYLYPYMQSQFLGELAAGGALRGNPRLARQVLNSRK